MAEQTRLYLTWKQICATKPETATDKDLLQLAELVLDSCRTVGTPSPDITKFIFSIFTAKVRQTVSDHSGLALFNFLSSKVGIYLIWCVEVLAKDPITFKSAKSVVSTTISLVTAILSLPEKQLIVTVNSSGVSEFAPEFCVCSFPPIETIFQVSPLPPVLTAYQQSSQVYQDPHRSSDDDHPLCAMVCFRLLSVLINFSKDNFALQELASRSKLRMIFVHLLHNPAHGLDHGLLMIQRQLIRVCAALSNEVCFASRGGGREAKWCQIFEKNDVVPSLLRSLRNITSTPGIICIDLAEVLVYLIKETCPFTPLLFDQFTTNNGAEALIANLIELGVSGIKDQQIRLILACCHLLYVPIQKAYQIPNLSAISILVTACQQTQSPGMRATILSVTYEIFKLSTTEEKELLLDTQLFEVLFDLFPSLTIFDRKLTLKMLNQIFREPAADKFTIEKIQPYVNILSSKSPSSIILVSRNLTKLLKSSRIPRASLEQLEILQILIPFLDMPTETWDSIPQNEISDCSGLLFYHTETLSQTVTKSIIALLETILMENNTLQNEFASLNGLEKLYPFLKNKVLRNQALSVIAIVAIGNAKLEPSIVIRLIMTLQTTGTGAATLSLDSVEMRKDILACLCLIIEGSVSTAKAFCEAGGFAWIESVLVALPKQVKPYQDQRNQRTKDIIFTSVQGIMSVLARTVAFIPQNMKSLLKVLVSSLNELGYFAEPRYVIPTLDSLIDICVQGWPPHCPIHPQLQFENKFSMREDAPALLHRDERIRTSVLPLAKERLEKCFSCEVSLKIQAPVMIKILLKILSRGYTGDTHDQPWVSTPNLLLVMETINFLAGYLPNLHILTSAGITGHMLKHFRWLLIQNYEGQPEPLNIRSTIMSLIIKVASYHISLSELRQYLDLIRYPGYPIILLESLVQITKRELSPTSFCHFPKRQISYIQCPHTEFPNWPPSRGYTISMWIEVHSVKSVLSIFSVHLSNTQSIKCQIRNGLLVFFSRESEIEFESFAFEEKRWYHVLLSHQGGTPAVSATNISLYINGSKVQTKLLPYPASKQESPNFCFGVQNLTNKTESRLINASWSLGNVYVLDSSIIDIEAFRLYCIGPDFVGGLVLKMDSFKVYDTIDKALIEEFIEKVDLLNISQCSVSHLHDRIIMAFSAKQMVYATHEIQDKKKSTQLKVLKDLVVTEQGVSSITRESVKNVIYNAGGISVVIFMIVTTKEKAHQKLTIRLLQQMLEWNPINLTQMTEKNGYQIIAKSMRKDYWVLDDELLGIIFELCGLTKSESTGYYSEGFVKNLEAFSHLVFNWEIWCCASHSTQKLLFRSVADLLGHGGNTSVYNVIRIRQIEGRSILLRMLEEPDFPLEFAKDVISILNRIMHDPWELQDVNDMFRFLMATHSGDALPPSLRAFRNGPSMNPSSVSSSVDFDDGIPQIEISSKTIPAMSVRDLLIENLLEALQKSPQVNSQFFSVCSYEVILTLLETQEETTRIVILRLLNCYLRQPENREHFRRNSGFHLLGFFLRSQPITERSLGVLMSIMLGAHTTSLTTAENFYPIQNYFIHQNEPIKLVSSEILISLLFAVTNQILPLGVKHLVIQIIHDVFLQSENAKEEFIRLGVVDLLCPIFLSEAERKCPSKKGKMASGLKSPLKSPVTLRYERSPLAKLRQPNFNISGSRLSHSDPSTFTGEPPETDSINDDEWLIEEDVLSFLRTIAIYGCASRNGIATLRTILTGINILPLSSEYQHALQNRLMTEVLSFYFNSKTNDPHIVDMTNDLFLLVLHYTNFLNQPSVYNQPSGTVDPGKSSPGGQQDASSKKGISGNSTFWKASSYLLGQDEALLKLIFEIIRNNINKERNESIFEKMSKAFNKAPTAQYKTGFETLINTYLTSPIIPEYIILLVLKNMVAIDATEISVDEYHFVARLFFYSAKFLRHPNQAIVQECRKLWKFHLDRKHEFMKRIVYMPPSGMFDKDQFKIMLSDSLPSLIKELEATNTDQRNEQRIIKDIIDTKAGERKNRIELSKLQSGLTVMTINVQQAIMKPLLVHVQKMVATEKQIRRHWKKLLKLVTHPSAVWPLDPTLRRWELDPIEGPMRMRLRLKPRLAIKHPIIKTLINADIDKLKKELESQRFTDPRMVYLSTNLNTEALNQFYNLYSLFDTNLDSEFSQVSEEITKPDLISGETILHVFDCSHITPFHKRDGNILIGEYAAYFIDEHEFKDSAEEKRQITSVRRNIVLEYEEIKEIHRRRHLLRDCGIELFLLNGKTHFLAFKTIQERDRTFMELMKNDLPNLNRAENETILEGKTSLETVKKWQKGLITNFEYLMYLNTVAGRSYNDLTQYPVFPFITADHDSPELDLTNPASFRDLTLPMGAQDQARLESKFEDQYKTLLEMNEIPYMYGSHYSNIGTVLHYMIRLEPFSQYLIEFQSGKFDVPDRVFHSLDTSWLLSSKQSHADVKELIPEFFCLPLFLVNANNFDLGIRSNKTTVGDVEMPAWAKGSPRFFIYKHREALECDTVSSQISEWIDLIFGYLQTGEDALAAKNVFHPLTYEGAIDIDNINDPVRKAATITQINNFGQTPRKLFSHRHPRREKLKITPNVGSDPDKLRSVRLGNQIGPIGFATFLDDKPIFLKANLSILWDQFSGTKTRCLQWGNWDGSLRVLILKTNEVVSSLEWLSVQRDVITCADIPQDGRLIACGAKSSLVRIWRKQPRYIKKHQRQQSIKKASGFIDEPNIEQSRTRKRVVEIEFAGVLDGHRDQVLCIKVSSEFSIVVSGSADRTCIIWDSARLVFVQSLSPHNGPVIAVDVHCYLGEIVVIDDAGNDEGTIHLWTINGEKVTSRKCRPKALCVTFSRVKPGLGRNVIFSGHVNGDISIWCANTLNLLRTIRAVHNVAVSALAVNQNNDTLISGDIDGFSYQHKIPQEGDS